MLGCWYRRCPPADCIRGDIEDYEVASLKVGYYEEFTDIVFYAEKLLREEFPEILNRNFNAITRALHQIAETTTV